MQTARPPPTLPSPENSRSILWQSTEVNLESHSTNYISSIECIIDRHLLLHLLPDTHSSGLFSRCGARCPVTETLMQFLFGRALQPNCYIWVNDGLQICVNLKHWLSAAANTARSVNSVNSWDCILLFQCDNTLYGGLSSEILRKGMSLSSNSEGVITGSVPRHGPTCLHL